MAQLGSKQISHTCDYGHRRVEDGPADFYAIEGAGEEFTDATFPPSDAIQWSDLGAGERRDLSFIELSAKWARLKDVFPADDGYSLWGTEGVRPADIKQGQIGNCWFLSGAAAVAEKPDRLQKVFLNRELSSEGIYALQMYALGVPFTLTIDDTVPLWDPSDMTLFADIG